MRYEDIICDSAKGTRDLKTGFLHKIGVLATSDG